MSDSLNNYIENNPEFYDYSSKYTTKNLLSFDEINQLLLILEPIVNSEFWKRIKSYPHHDDSRGHHIMSVVFRAYYISIKRKLSPDQIKKTVYIAIFHDCFDYDWKLPLDYKPKFKELHAFSHPERAFIEAKRYFPELIDEEVENGIKSHMFPLTITKLPKYRTGWIVLFADKYAAKRDAKNMRDYPMYLNLNQNFINRYQKVYDFFINKKIYLLIIFHFL